MYSCSNMACINDKMPTYKLYLDDNKARNPYIYTCGYSQITHDLILTTNKTLHTLV